MLGFYTRLLPFPPLSLFRFACSFMSLTTHKHIAVWRVRVRQRMAYDFDYYSPGTCEAHSSCAHYGPFDRGDMANSFKWLPLSLSICCLARSLYASSCSPSLPLPASLSSSVSCYPSAILSHKLSLSCLRCVYAT